MVVKGIIIFLLIEEPEPSTKYYSLYKARMVPTTFIIKARK
ncbi:ubiquinone biosynthesis protein UbiE [Bacillus thuringiensis serovar ostriniae]|nr:ubiquinone biosynthesis protein UbiE [Bacillus thuringiensis serovar ostriniae]HDR8193951.1 ubiquinone biosynthesis protein UbiE [Bacillus thuringiensis]